MSIKASVAAFFICLLFFTYAFGEIPQYINYQGYLTDDLGAPVPDGDYNIIFFIYDAPVDGTVKWASDRLTVAVQDGLFNQRLGPMLTSVFTQSSARYLAIRVEGEDIDARTQLISAPYAFHAFNSDDWLDSSGNIYRLNNYVGVGVDDPKTKLEVAGVMRILRDDDYVPPGDGEGMELYYDPIEGVGVIDVFERPMGYRNFSFAHGSVGIGVKTMDERLHVAGKVQATDFVTKSDARLKTNIEKLENVLDRLDQINPVSFDWNEIYQSMEDVEAVHNIGVIAQEVEKVFPELVTSRGEAGYKSVSYNQLTAVLLEAVKELKAQNVALQKRIEILEQR